MLGRKLQQRGVAVALFATNSRAVVQIPRKQTAIGQGVAAVVEEEKTCFRV